MPGLLGDGWEDPRSAAIMALSAGLLQRNPAAALLGANNAYGNAKNDALKQQYVQAQIAETQAQAQQRQAAARKEQEALEQAARLRQAIPGLFQGPGMTGGAVGQAAGGFDVQRALQLGMDPKMIQEYAGLSNVGRPEVARVEETMVGGRPVKRQFDKYGAPVGDPLEQWKAPVFQSLGNRAAALDPVTLKERGSFPIGMSPSERDASARGWAGIGIQREQAAAGKLPLGYRWKADGTGQEPIPGGPADIKAGAEGIKRTTDANDVLSILNEVDRLLPKSTGSYTGAGYDAVAAGVFGHSTEGAKTAAQLRALQGALVSKMPKMSGPQSDKDVQLYREMAGQVGDSTIPIEQRQAAADMVRKLNEKYAGLEEGSSKPNKPSRTAQGPVTVDALPKDAHNYKGKVATDTATGKRYRSNGMSWVEEK